MYNEDQPNKAAMTKARQEFVSGMLAELRAVEGAKEGESIYTGAAQALEVNALDVTCPQRYIAYVTPQVNSWRLCEGVFQVDEIKLRCNSVQLGLCALGRSCKRNRKETDLRPWIGYNYKSIHASIVKFSEAAARVRTQHKQQNEAKRAARATLAFAIRNAGFVAKDAGYEIQVVLDPTCGRVLPLGQDGQFALCGKLTTENAARVLRAIKTLDDALKGD
jgi:hypothetical protein